MTKYEYFLAKQAQCKELERQATDIRMKIFYSNAAFGFMCKAYNLSLQEASN